MEITENSMKLRRQYVAPQITEVIDLSDVPLMGNVGSLTGKDTSTEDTDGFEAKRGTFFDDDDIFTDHDEDGYYKSSNNY